MVKKLKVIQIQSAIGRQQRQKDTIKGLGIKRLHQPVYLEDSPAIRGMIQKVIHLVKFEEVEFKE